MSTVEKPFQNKIYLYFVYFFLFTMPLFIFSTPLGFLALFEILAPLGFIAILLQRNFRISAIPLLFFLFVLTLFFTNILVIFFKNTQSFDQFLVIRSLLSLTPILLLDQLNTISKEQLSRIEKLLLVSLTITVFITLILFFFGIELRSNQQRVWFEGGSLARAGGLTGNSSGAGLVASLFIIYIFSLRILNTKVMKPFLFLLLALMGMLALFVTNSRSGLILISAFMLINLFFNWKKMKSSILGDSIFAGLIALIFSFSILSLFSQDILLFFGSSLDRWNFLNTDGSFYSSARFLNWPIVIDSIKENPLLGLGYKQFNYIYGIDADNAFLSVAIDGGFFSLSAYIFFWIFCMIFHFRKATTVNRQHIIIFGIIFSCFIISFFLDLYTMWYPSAILFAVIGVLQLRLKSSRQL